MREHAEALQPPRSLWVPFVLGRPLGVPNDPAFQRRVVQAALALFERAAGPVLEDYPEDAPPVSVDSDAGMACPVSFYADPAHSTPAQQVAAEISQLQVWHDLALKKQGRTATGVAGVPMHDAARYLAARAAGEPAEPYRNDVPSAEALRLASEDLKAFYSEAVMAQPGRHTVESIQDWFWGQTAGGALLLALQKRLEHADDKLERSFATGSLVPRRIAHTVGSAGH